MLMLLEETHLKVSIIIVMLISLKSILISHAFIVSSSSTVTSRTFYYRACKEKKIIRGRVFFMKHVMVVDVHAIEFSWSYLPPDLPADPLLSSLIVKNHEKKSHSPFFFSFFHQHHDHHRHDC